jgi:ketosteroid isomerase-like protein
MAWAYEVMTHGAANAIEGLLSREAGLLVVGSDPNEWWVGHEMSARVFKAQVEEMGGNLQIEAGDIAAFAEDSVGWAVDRPTMRMPNGQAIPMRVTAIFHHEDGAWRIVHWHASMGVTNASIVGKELTTQ